MWDLGERWVREENGNWVGQESLWVLMDNCAKVWLEDKGLWAGGKLKGAWSGLFAQTSFCACVSPELTMFHPSGLKETHADMRVLWTTVRILQSVQELEARVTGILSRVYDLFLLFPEMPRCCISEWDAQILRTSKTIEFRVTHYGIAKFMVVPSLDPPPHTHTHIYWEQSLLYTSTPVMHVLFFFVLSLLVQHLWHNRPSKWDELGRKQLEYLPNISTVCPLQVTPNAYDTRYQLYPSFFPNFNFISRNPFKILIITQ